MRTVLYVLLTYVVAASYAAIPNFYDIGDEEECPSGTRCMPAELCPGAAQPFGPFGRGGQGLRPGLGLGWGPVRRPARCASVLPGARVCCWSPAGLPPPYQPRLRPARQAPPPPPPPPTQTGRGRPLQASLARDQESRVATERARRPTGRERRHAASLSLDSE